MSEIISSFDPQWLASKAKAGDTEPVAAEGPVWLSLVFDPVRCRTGVLGFVADKSDADKLLADAREVPEQEDACYELLVDYNRDAQLTCQEIFEWLLSLGVPTSRAAKNAGAILEMCQQVIDKLGYVPVMKVNDPCASK